MQVALAHQRDSRCWEALLMLVWQPWIAPILGHVPRGTSHDLFGGPTPTVYARWTSPKKERVIGGLPVQRKKMCRPKLPGPNLVYKLAQFLDTTDFHDSADGEVHIYLHGYLLGRCSYPFDADLTKVAQPTRPPGTNWAIMDSCKLMVDVFSTCE